MNDFNIKFIASPKEFTLKAGGDSHMVVAAILTMVQAIYEEFKNNNDLMADMLRELMCDPKAPHWNEGKMAKGFDVLSGGEDNEEV